MRLKEIYEAVDDLAPFALSHEYCQTIGFHDNSGVQLDCGKEIGSVLFSLDLSSSAVKRAKELGADLVVTHHPAIFTPLYSLQTQGEGKEVLECAREGISVISAHLNLDCARGGIDDSLAEGLGGKIESAMHNLSNGSYGKACSIKQISFAEFVENIKAEFGAERIVTYGGRNVKKYASFCGAGMDGDSVAFALRSGADTFVSSDGKHHLVAELVEKGVNVVLLTHYCAEYYGFRRFYEKMKLKLKERGVRAELFADGRFL